VASRTPATARRPGASSAFAAGRRSAWTVGLVAAAGALAWALLSLVQLFGAERAEALGALDGEREAVAAYARSTLGESLDAALESARARVDAAAADPLADAAGLLLVDRGRAVLPRPERPLAGDETPAHALYVSLRGGDAKEAAARAAAEAGNDPDDPWAARLALAASLRDALASGADAEIERAVRALLAHAAYFALPATRDIPLWLATLEPFVATGRADRRLMQALLRDGLSLSPAARITGLERALLLAAPRLRRADFALLAEQIARLAERADVRTDDFRERVTERLAPASPPALAEAASALAGPALLGGGAWYATQGPDGRTRGLATGGAVALETEAAARMRARGLLGEADTLRIEAPLADIAPLAELRIAVDAPRFALRERVIRQRHAAKTALALGCGVLLLGIGLALWVAAQRKARLLALRSEMIAAVSHELRTPLASIRLQAETLQRRLADPGAARDYAQRIVRDIDGLTFMVENILSYNRLERGGWRPKRCDTTLAELVASQHDDLADLRVKHTMTTTGDTELPLHVDPELMKLLLSNLVRNACQYGERVPVEIAIEGCPGAEPRVLVHDNARGIAHERWEQVFVDFYREPESASTRGSGLGLALARRIMRAHGGELAIVASSAEGTTFELRFPCRA
jgi:signal transduction histidine kinase